MIAPFKPAVGVHLLCFLAVLVMLFAEQFDRFADDPGVGWHLATGARILEMHEVPRVDPFLRQPDAATAQRPWVSDQWLSDVLLSVLVGMGGWKLGYGFFTVLYCGVFFGVLHRTVSRATGRPLAAGIATLLAAKVSQIHFIFRPVMFSFLLFALLTAVLADARRRGAISRSHFAGVALLFVVWSNLHPSFALGLVLLGGFAAEVAVSRFVLGRGEPAYLRAAFVAVAVGGVATVLNPYGIELHRSIVSLGGSDFFMNFHEEWRSVDFKRPEGQLTAVILGIIVLALASDRKRTLEEHVGELIPLACFTYLALSTVRVLPYFSMVAAAPLARSFDLLARSSRSIDGGLIARAYARFDDREHRTSRGQLLAGVVVLCAVPLVFAAGLAGQSLGPSASEYPYGAVEAILKAVPEEKVVVASSPDWGGFLTGFGGGRLVPIIDDRNTMLGEAFYREYFDNMRWYGNWRQFLTRFGTEFLLLPKDSPLGLSLLREGSTAPFFRDDVSMVFRLERAS